jgi:branched-chain amino acid transport system ATP-binding protein
MALLSITDLSISFGGLTALNKVSMDVEGGRIFSIIGPNGAGKTTVFNCITGIYRPNSGSIRFQGKEIVGKKPHQAARMGIARTFQNIELFAHLSCIDNLLLGRHIHMKTGIFPVAALPYGTRKLVELGRALAMEPSLLLLDEPTAGMNQEEKRDMMFWIKDIRDEFQITVIMVEHDMGLVMDVSDEVLALNFGLKLVQGPPEEVQNHPEVLEAYLGEE